MLHNLSLKDIIHTVKKLIFRWHKSSWFVCLFISMHTFISSKKDHVFLFTSDLFCDCNHLIQNIPFSIFQTLLNHSVSNNFFFVLVLFASIAERRDMKFSSFCELCSLCWCHIKLFKFLFDIVYPSFSGSSSCPASRSSCIVCSWHKLVTFHSS